MQPKEGGSEVTSVALALQFLQPPPPHLDPVSSSAFPQPGPLLSSLADLGPGLVAGGSSFLEIHLALTSFPVL